MKQKYKIEVQGHYFDVLKSYTVSGGSKIRKYKNSHNLSLGDCYVNYSDDKERAYSYCINLCKELNGKRYRVTSHTCHTFSFGFTLPSGEVIYITRDHDYIII